MPWLAKAEPDTRIVNGQDVAFSVDQFEKLGSSPWDGVRSHQAKNFMKNQMKIDDQVLFYHSNTKIPGIAGIARVSKEGYPDYTAWDPKHPYYDLKSDGANPTWYMVDVAFVRRLPYFVALKLLQYITSFDEIPFELAYLQKKHLDSLKEMMLLKRGRLSVQPVEPLAFEAITLLGDNGGWEELKFQKHKSTSKKRPSKHTDTKSESWEDDNNRVQSTDEVGRVNSLRASKRSRRGG